MSIQLFPTITFYKKSKEFLEAIKNNSNVETAGKAFLKASEDNFWEDSVPFGNELTPYSGSDLAAASFNLLKLFNAGNPHLNEAEKVLEQQGTSFSVRELA